MQGSRSRSGGFQAVAALALGAGFHRRCSAGLGPAGYGRDAPARRRRIDDRANGERAGNKRPASRQQGGPGPAAYPALGSGCPSAAIPIRIRCTGKLSDKEQFKQQKEVREELKGPYKKWVNEDVHWIITDQELKAFKSLSNDEERDNFIEQFWLRRNPNPDSPENEFREEHYRRIAYANEHFAAGKPGWKTDRGHIYISFGKPDSIDSHPSGGSYERPMDEGGG